MLLPNAGFGRIRALRRSLKSSNLVFDEDHGYAVGKHSFEKYPAGQGVFWRKSSYQSSKEEFEKTFLKMKSISQRSSACRRMIRWITSKPKFYFRKLHAFCSKDIDKNSSDPCVTLTLRPG